MIKQIIPPKEAPMSIKLKKLLPYRDLWLGIAMAWIVFAHSGYKPGSMLFTYLKAWGYGGVDLCLFASGLGCYFSLDKDPDTLRFLRRRILRLAPTYIPFIALWCVYHYLTHGPYPLPALLGNFLGIQNLTGLENSFNWYISALLLLYLLSPLFKDLTDRLSYPRQLLVITFLLLLSVPFWTADTYIITLTRLPIYYCGMVFARMCKEDRSLTPKALAIALLTSALGFALMRFCTDHFESILWSYGLHWYPFLLITPGVCIAISLVGILLEKVKFSKILTTPLATIGKYSFELYLIHVPLYEFLHPRLRELPYPRNLMWLATLPVIALGCIALKLTANLITSYILRRGRCPHRP